MKVLLLAGGRSVEAEVSQTSGNAVEAALKNLGFEVVRVDPEADGLEALLRCEAEVALLVTHGRYGEDGALQGVLEWLKIPYTGSGVAASAIAMDKSRTRILAQAVGVRVGEQIVPGAGIPPGRWVVKPQLEGSSVGITISDDPEILMQAQAELLDQGVPVVVERFVAGREITVPVFEGRAMPPVEIRVDQGFYDYTHKYTGGTQYDAPAQIGEAATAACQQAAEATYRAVGCRGLARVDFILPEGEEPVMLEINTLPGMTGKSLAPMSAKAMGWSFDDLIARQLAAARLGS
ncbi:MAG: D-alanine--D-alanine ligase [Alphaproteobacteria bacterium CG_4_10_14_0_2_um_filter_63_37]|nr:MAG: hypothetical protein AUJ55_00825 [Proteobacteria bacterium CG1_02_64_396]PJA24591.1 MAG: D-alanine--D-alanine ligase [Alphaproteobacteria bacterium CG_4_10_14_0_2_um_filter_63_37]